MGFIERLKAEAEARTQTRLAADREAELKAQLKKETDTQRAIKLAEYHAERRNRSMLALHESGLYTLTKELGRAISYDGFSEYDRWNTRNDGIPLKNGVALKDADSVGYMLEWVEEVRHKEGFEDPYSKDHRLTGMVVNKWGKLLVIEGTPDKTLVLYYERGFLSKKEILIPEQRWRGNAALVEAALERVYISASRYHLSYSPSSAEDMGLRR